MVQAFVDFYTNLYTSKVHYTFVELDDYLFNIPLSKLSPDQVSALEAPLTVDELEVAMLSFARNKTPGLDGFLIEWYSQYKEILLSHERGCLPTYVRSAHRAHSQTL